MSWVKIECLKCDCCHRQHRGQKPPVGWRSISDFYGNTVHACTNAACREWLQNFKQDNWPSSDVREVNDAT